MCHQQKRDNHNKISQHNFLSSSLDGEGKVKLNKKIANEIFSTQSKMKIPLHMGVSGRVGKGGKCEKFCENNLYNCSKKTQKSRKNPKKKQEYGEKIISFTPHTLRCYRLSIVCVSMTGCVCFWQCSKMGEMGKSKCKNVKIIENSSAIECQMGLPAAIWSGLRGGGGRGRGEKLLSSQLERVEVLPVPASSQTSSKWNQQQQQHKGYSTAVAKIIKKMFTICHLTFMWGKWNWKC